jgi:PncC family amidohydrolase
MAQSNVQRRLDTASKALAEWLLNRETTRVVFAESCTAGLVSASLAAHPGISQVHCGSAVTYRAQTKSHWLDVSPALITQHSAESIEVAQEMATHVLMKTPEAEFSAAITGHLGPDAPKESDGCVFQAIARRFGTQIDVVSDRSTKLTMRDRIDRQAEAAALLMETLLMAMQQSLHGLAH